jgi:hypothetical protein
MNKLLVKALPWLLLGGAVFGGIKVLQANARAQGRIEVLIEQRDSALVVHDSAMFAIQQTVDSQQTVYDSLKGTETVLIEELLVEVPDTVLVERIRTVIDTIRARCFVCEQQRDLLQLGLDREKAQHRITRNLLTTVRAQSGRRFSFAVTLGVSTVYDLIDKNMHVGPGVTVGISIHF